MIEFGVVALTAVVFVMGFASGVFWGEITERKRSRRAYPRTRRDLVVYQDEPYKAVRIIPSSQVDRS